MAKRGRPSDYSETIAERICIRLLKPETLLAICRDKAMPSQATVYRWMEQNPEFREKMIRARAAQAHILFDQTLIISDDMTSDNPVKVARAKLMIESRRWYISKVLPKKFGDKLDLGMREGDPLGAFLLSLAGTALRPVERQATAVPEAPDLSSLVH
jgi:hypothetical protein